MEYNTGLFVWENMIVFIETKCRCFCRTPGPHSSVIIYKAYTFSKTASHIGLSQEQD